MSDPPPMTEAGLTGTPLHDLGLQIAGTPLEPILAEFDREVAAAGLASVNPTYFLADEWGVPFPSTGIGIPFYLARPDLTRFHGERTGLVEGVSRADILRYLRHEFGHAVNYAYALYEREEWTAAFGPFTRPYPDEYRPKPFSRAFVRHLPGWYAQKHPDEDWAETFAVWMTPHRDWRAEYADWPTALHKLETCARLVKAVAGTPPTLVPAGGEDEEEVDFFGHTLADVYGEEADEELSLPGLDGALRAAFDEADEVPAAERRAVGDLLRRLEGELVANLFRWTGHFPERGRPLIRHVANRADALGQVYPADREASAVLAATALLTGLAMNHVYTGEYFPAADRE